MKHFSVVKGKLIFFSIQQMEGIIEDKIDVPDYIFKNSGATTAKKQYKRKRKNKLGKYGNLTDERPEV